MTPEDRAELERWRRIAATTPGRTARTLLDACNAIEAMQHQHDVEVKRLREENARLRAELGRPLTDDERAFLEIR